MTDWSAYRSYRCLDCNQQCINRLDEPWTEATKCRGCHTVDPLPAPTSGEADAEDRVRAALAGPEEAR